MEDFYGAVGCGMATWSYYRIGYFWNQRLKKAWYRWKHYTRVGRSVGVGHIVLPWWSDIAYQANTFVEAGQIIIRAERTRAPVRSHYDYHTLQSAFSCWPNIAANSKAMMTMSHNVDDKPEPAKRIFVRLFSQVHEHLVFVFLSILKIRLVLPCCVSERVFWVFW